MKNISNWALRKAENVTILLFLIGAANGTSGKNKNIFFPEMIISGRINVQVLLATKVPPHKTFFLWVHNESDGIWARIFRFIGEMTLVAFNASGLGEKHSKNFFEKF